MSENLTKIYGIDLGTTYSCIAYVDEHEKPVIVKNAENESTTPSVVFFEDRDNVIVGSEAKANSVLYPQAVVSCVKRSMGDPNFQFEYDGENYKPEEISALILRKLVNDAEQSTGEKITDVVITCPAYFGINEREATKIAGEIQGLNVRQIINEPTAAALSYGLAENTGEKVVLVYDLGGGTFDITMIDIKPDAISVICTGGDHSLGGKDWDDLVVQYLSGQFQEKSGTADDILDDPDTCQALQLAAEDAKKSLSSRNKKLVPVVHGGDKEGIELTREKFEEITENLLEQTISLTEDMLEEAKDKGYHTFDEILLVGGSVRMPQVRERIKEAFSVEPKIFDPDEAVAKGAALYGWKLSINDQLIKRIKEETGKEVGDINDPRENDISGEEMEKIAQSVADDMGFTLDAVKSANTTLRDVCSKSFGVVALRQEEELVVNLITKNTTVPLEVTKQFGTNHDNQETIALRIMENEVKDSTNSVENSAEIATATMEMPPNLPAGSPIDITFVLNGEGRLDITAVEVEQNTKVNITVETNSILQEKELEKAKTRSSGITVL